MPIRIRLKPNKLVSRRALSALFCFDNAASAPSSAGENMTEGRAEWGNKRTRLVAQQLFPLKLMRLDSVETKMLSESLYTH